jgi:hypothetical protein
MDLIDLVLENERKSDMGSKLKVFINDAVKCEATLR